MIVYIFRGRWCIRIYARISAAAEKTKGNNVTVKMPFQNQTKHVHLLNKSYFEKTENIKSKRHRFRVNLKTESMTMYESMSHIVGSAK